MNTLIQVIREKIQSSPRGLYVAFYTEMWELFGRFGIISLLIFYLTKTFHLTDARAFVIYSGFLALIYVTPIVCGYLSDRFLGLKHAVILGATLMIVGNALMVIPQQELVFLGLSLVSVGSGFFLPSLVPMVSNLYEGSDRGRDAGFTLYYIGKNIGALLAPIFCGIVAQLYGYNYAFILSALGMLSGLVVFIRGKKHLVDSGSKRGGFVATRPEDKGKRYIALTYLVAAVMVPVILWILDKGMDGYLLALAGLAALVVMITLAMRSKQSAKKLLVIVLFVPFVILFSGVLGQGGTTLNLFIERIVDRHLWGFNLPPSFFYTLDPIFMIALGPLLAMVWTALAKRRCEPKEASKFGWSMLLLSAGFFVFYWAAGYGVQSGHASPLFIVLAYFLFPLAELCIMPIGLSMVTKLAPKGQDAMMVGIWMLAQSAGGYLTGEISKFGQINFAYNTLPCLQHASAIYQQLFAGNGLALLATALLLWLVIRPLVAYLLRD